jgi:c-di-GMP phosphodiesterase
MDVLLGLPMEEVLERLPVSEDVRDALLDGRSARHDAHARRRLRKRRDWALVEALRVARRRNSAEHVREAVSVGQRRLSRLARAQG